MEHNCQRLCYLHMIRFFSFVLSSTVFLHLSREFSRQPIVMNSYTFTHHTNWKIFIKGIWKRATESTHCKGCPCAEITTCYLPSIRANDQGLYLNIHGKAWSKSVLFQYDQSQRGLWVPWNPGYVLSNSVFPAHGPDPFNENFTMHHKLYLFQFPLPVMQT